MNKKKAKFFCENCGEEVEKNARFCRKCGKFFTSVRCPACGFVGSANSFLNGCPKCGYAENGSRSSRKEKTKIKHNTTESTLPVWIYIFTGFVLIAIFVAIVYLYSA